MIWLGAVSLDLAVLVRSIDPGVPRKPVAIFLALIAILLSAAYLGQTLRFYTTGAVPEPIELADAPTLFVYVLDLGLIVPLALIAASWLWRRSPWGYVLAGGSRHCAFITGSHHLADGGYTAQ
jgi:hypothetical protein